MRARRTTSAARPRCTRRTPRRGAPSPPPVPSSTRRRCRRRRRRRRPREDRRQVRHAPRLGQVRARLRREAEALRVRDADARPAQVRGEHQRPGHVVGVADPGDREVFGGAEGLLDREQVGEDLDRVRLVGEQVDDRARWPPTARRSSLRVLEDPGADERAVARRTTVPRSSADSRVSKPTSSSRTVTGWPPSCAVAISIEMRVRADGFSNSRTPPLPSSTCGGSAELGQVEHAVDLAHAQVGDLEEVPHAVASDGPADRRRRRGRARRRRSAGSGASRSAVGVTALTTTPSSRRRRATVAASHPMASGRARPRAAGPARGPPATPSERAEWRAVSRSPACRARPGTSSRSMIAEHGAGRRGRRAVGRRRSWRGRPARTRRPRRPGPSTRRSASPLPSALAIVTTSGRTPKCWWPNHSPVRPSPVCTSSTMNRMPRSSHSAADAAEVLGGGGVDPALALHRLEQHRRDRVVERRPRARRGRSTPRGGSPRAAAGTPRAWPAGRWRGGWPACGRGTSRRPRPRRDGPDRRTCGRA